MKLNILSGGLAGQSLSYDDDSLVTIGSDPSNYLTLVEDGVSGIHACIKKVDHNWILSNIESTNGVFHNGQRISANVILKHQDKIKISLVEMSLQLKAAKVVLTPLPKKKSITASIDKDSLKKNMTVKSSPKKKSITASIDKDSLKKNVTSKSSPKKKSITASTDKDSLKKNAERRKAARQKAVLKARITKAIVLIILVMVSKHFYPQLMTIYEAAQKPNNTILANTNADQMTSGAVDVSDELDPIVDSVSLDTSSIDDADEQLSEPQIEEESEVDDSGRLEKYKDLNATLDFKDFHKLIQKHCAECHNPKKIKGDFDVTIFSKPESFYVYYDFLIHFFDQVETGSMPPEEDSKMTAGERQALTGYIGKTLYKLENTATKQTGPTKIRRLTGYEYDNTVKAVTGLDLQLSANFAMDGAGGEGFSNDSSILSVSPLQFEQYLQAAEIISSYSRFDFKNGFTFSNSEVNPASKKESLIEIQAEIDHTLADLYPKDFSIKTYLPKLMKAVNEFNKADRKASRIAEISSKYNINPSFLKKGSDYLNSSFDKSIIERDLLRPWQELKRKNYDEKSLLLVIQDFRKAYLQSIKKVMDEPNSSASPELMFKNNVAQVFTYTEKELLSLLEPSKLSDYKSLIALQDFLEKGARSRYRSSISQLIQPHIEDLLFKAHRQPPDNKQVYEMTKDFLAAMTQFGLPAAARLFVIRTFINMKFIYRHETKAGRTSRVTDYELASRLSYFLWSHPPDEELLQLAAEKRLSQPDVLMLQVKRMIKNKKSSGLAKYFAAQWLQFQRILTFDGINKEQFPEFNDALAQDMWRETALCFEYIVKMDRSVLELIDADYTFLNGNLKKHYGMEHDFSGFSKVMLKDKNRGGVLGHASILTATSAALRTSPILRGNWVINALLRTPTPPAPAEVEPLPDEEVVSENLTLKKQLEAHRNSSNCRGCHQKIDPIGFPLENYDVLGRWRDKYQTAPIDSTGELVSGRIISGPQGLKKYLLKQKKSYLKNMSRKLFGYALGRSIKYYDFYVINNMVKSLKENDYKFSAMVFEIVNSHQFQHKN